MLIYILPIGFAEFEEYSISSLKSEYLFFITSCLNAVKSLIYSITGMPNLLFTSFKAIKIFLYSKLILFNSSRVLFKSASSYIFKYDNFCSIEKFILSAISSAVLAKAYTANKYFLIFLGNKNEPTGKFS